MPVRFGLSTLMLCVAVAAGIFTLVDCSCIAVWQGRFPLQVELLGTHNREIVEVAAEAIHAPPETVQLVKTAPSKLGLNLARMEWSDGQPFTVSIPTSGHTSYFGRELAYGQYKLLVLRLSFADGSVEFIPVDIPDGRVSRHVAVTIADHY